MSSWHQEVLQAHGLVMVAFMAPWCDPCTQVSPLLEELAAERTDRVRVVVVDVDESPDLGSRYKVSIVPTVMFFRGGVKMDEIICVPEKSLLQMKIDLL
jgi:thioredoxin 1